MRTQTLIWASAALAAVPAVAAAAVMFGGPVESPTAAAKAARSALAGWPPVTRELAEALSLEYGPPDRTTPDRLSWRNRGPWRRVVVFRAPRRPGLLLQSVAYFVPVQRWRALSACGLATYDVARRELVARGDDERTNRLALNLAVEVVRGRLDPAEARARYREILRAQDGRELRRLLFSPDAAP
jgi:hypothetical protein